MYWPTLHWAVSVVVDLCKGSVSTTFSTAFPSVFLKLTVISNFAPLAPMLIDGLTWIGKFCWLGKFTLIERR